MAKKHNKKSKVEFIRNGRIGTHIKNCKLGYKESGYSQIHHILCHSCLQDSAITAQQADKSYINRCIKITKWDINAEPNVVGLPLKSAYYKKYNQSKQWNGWPCHQIDHNPNYTQAVKDWLQDKVWNTLKAKKANCDADEKCIASLLEKSRVHWKAFLEDRGGQEGGTKKCWDERKSTKKDVWYIPFSMHPDDESIPKRLAPPDRWSGKMDDIFKLIK